MIPSELSSFDLSTVVCNLDKSTQSGTFDCNKFVPNYGAERCLQGDTILPCYSKGSEFID